MPDPIAVGTVVDLRQLGASLDELGARVRDARPWIEGYLRPAITTLVKEQFMTAGAAMGEHWAPLAPATVARKHRPDILRDTDEMYEAFTNPSHPDAHEIIDAMHYERGVQGEALEKALWATNGSARRPVRAVLGNGVPLPVVRAWSSSLLAYLRSGAIL